MRITVNISDACVAARKDDVIVTYSLGSCIGVTLYDPLCHVGGMLHFQLPTSTLDAERARQNPTMFADSGMDVLLSRMREAGARLDKLQVSIAGAAQILDDAGIFNIGKRNHAAIRKILWQKGLLIRQEDIGGSSPRNMYLNVADGAVEIRVVGLNRAASEK
jgi:chemotaxis protein CheD